MKSTITESGITYKLESDGLYYPQFELPDETAHYGKYGSLRKHFLKEHRNSYYSTLLMQGKLISHLNETDETAKHMEKELISKMAVAQGITEDIKSTDQMAWVRVMNNIRSDTQEIILNEIIYS